MHIFTDKLRDQPCQPVRFLSEGAGSGKYTGEEHTGPVIVLYCVMESWVRFSAQSQAKERVFRYTFTTIASTLIFQVETVFVNFTSFFKYNVSFIIEQRNVEQMSCYFVLYKLTNVMSKSVGI